MAAKTQDPGPRTLDPDEQRDCRRCTNACRDLPHPPLTADWRCRDLVEPRANARVKIGRRFGVDHQPRDAIDFIH
jgi:hypothetical protein